MTGTKKENPTEAAASESPPVETPTNAYRPPGMPTDEEIQEIQKQQKLHIERMQQAHQQEQHLNAQTLMYLQRQLMGDPANNVQPDPLITALVTDINMIVAQICRYAGTEYRPFLALDIFNAFCMPDWQNEWQQPWKPVTPPRYSPYIAGGAAEQALDARAAAIFGTQQPAPQTTHTPQANPQEPGHKRNTQFRNR